jgi:hypothetical protein
MDDVKLLKDTAALLFNLNKMINRLNKGTDRQLEMMRYWMQLTSKIVGETTNLFNESVRLCELFEEILNKANEKLDR